MKATLATPIGTRFNLRIYWGEGCSALGCHNATKHLGDTDILQDNSSFGVPENYKPEQWPNVCDKCGALVPNENINKQVFSSVKYDTPSGELEPGNLFWNTWYPDNMFWDNHSWPHLMAILPNGYEWCIDSRASNCGMPDDRTHRCWVRHGEVPNIHVDKNGNTCNAGAGSIWIEDYHGYLHNGEFTNA